MRLLTLTFIFILYCFTGCSQNGTQEMNLRNKIPIDSKRWYQLNNVSKDMSELFNGKKEEKVNIAQGALLDNYDAYYPLQENEQMTIDSIRFYDGEGTTEDHPMTVYAILNDWRKVPIAVFKGTKYNTWVGPDPATPDKIALKAPVGGIRYLVINSWGNFPGEIEFYGPYSAAKPGSAVSVQHVPLKNYLGVNAFEWDFEAPGNPMQLDPVRTAAIKNFTGVRHYMDWQKLEGREGTYAFAPTYNGNWNYDAIYTWCKEQNIEILPCLKTVPDWLLSGYPEKERDNENVPVRFGKDPADPMSYIEQAKVAFQFAARYGGNKNVNAQLLTLQSDNRVRTGLGLIKYIECENERDKWWKGRKAYQTGREYAANLSAFYDGNKNQMGQGVGVKNADPNMKVVMAGTASVTTDYVRGMIDWCKQYRGYKKDGSVDCPWDVINYHFYANDANADPQKAQTTGVAPEVAKADAYAKEFVRASHAYAGDMPVWVTETGYDLNQGSPQKAPAIKGRTALETQADWILRTSLLYARTGIQKLFFYQLVDDNSSNTQKYASSGLINNDRTNRAAADYINQVNRLFGNYVYKETLHKSPIVDKYTFKGSDMYMLVVPDQKGATATYTLDLGNSQSANIYKPKAGAKDMEMISQKTAGGKLQLTVTETPVFVTGKS